MQSLERPAVGNKLTSQGIEQLGMSRRLAELAEIAGRAHDPGAKVLLPDAVDDHAGRQRMVRPGKPARQLEPAAALCDRRLSLAREQDGEPSWNQFAKP